MKTCLYNIFQKIKKPFQQGLSFIEIFKAIIVSLFFTIIPVFGITTIILSIISLRFKLNLPVMISVSYLATPLQFLLFLPFIHIGERIFNMQHTLLTVQEIKNAFDVSFWQTINDLILELVCGVSGWLIISLPICLLLILSINYISNFLITKKQTN